MSRRYEQTSTLIMAQAPAQSGVAVECNEITEHVAGGGVNSTK